MLVQWETAGRETRRKDSCVNDDGAASVGLRHSLIAQRKDPASSPVRSSIARSSMARKG